MARTFILPVRPNERDLIRLVVLSVISKIADEEGWPKFKNGELERLVDEHTEHAVAIVEGRQP